MACERALIRKSASRNPGRLPSCRPPRPECMMNGLPALPSMRRSLLSLHILHLLFERLNASVE
jgi:hypothetical protein